MFLLSLKTKPLNFLKKIKAALRQKRTVQHSLFDFVLEYDITIELEATPNLLDAHPSVLDWVESGPCDRTLASTGRKGLSVEFILRCVILK